MYLLAMMALIAADPGRGGDTTLTLRRIAGRQAEFNQVPVILCGEVRTIAATAETVMLEPGSASGDIGIVLGHGVTPVRNGAVMCARGVIRRSDHLSNAEAYREGKASFSVVDDIDPLWRLEAD